MASFTLRTRRSSGVWSSVGHVVGLGDRHGENILIETESGECVHVDFDCLFDKVKTTKQTKTAISMVLAMKCASSC